MGDATTIITDIEKLGTLVAPLIPGVAQYEAVLTLLGGMFNGLYAQYQANHGAAIKSKEELLGLMAADTAEVAAGKIA